jgi:hypothetical protein
MAGPLIARKIMLPRLILVSLLAFCSSLAISQSKGNPAMPCFQALAGDPRFATIKDKVALGGGTDEMRRMTTGATRPGPQERPVLEAWRNARAECHQLELPYYATRDAEIQALAREHFAAVQALIGDLQAGTLTYDEFGTRRAALHEKVNRDIEKVRRSILPAKPVPLKIDPK